MFEGLAILGIEVQEFELQQQTASDKSPVPAKVTVDIE
jgi:hypothetical protein